MGTGLQVFDASGREIFGGADRLARVLGEYQNAPEGISAPSSGQFSIPNQATTSPWFFIRYLGDYAGNNRFANFSINGSIVSWVYESGGFNKPFVMTYGAY